jgi:hypothetical protein
VFSAIKPGTMTLGGMVIGISTPHKKAGLLYDRWKEFYGKDGTFWSSMRRLFRSIRYSTRVRSIERSSAIRLRGGLSG